MELLHILKNCLAWWKVWLIIAVVLIVLFIIERWSNHSRIPQNDQMEENSTRFNWLFGSGFDSFEEIRRRHEEHEEMNRTRQSLDDL